MKVTDIMLAAIAIGITLFLMIAVIPKNQSSKQLEGTVDYCLAYGFGDLKSVHVQENGVIKLECFESREKFSKLLYSLKKEYN